VKLSAQVKISAQVKLSAMAVSEMTHDDKGAI
jgi:hypothetical protein